MNETGAVEKKVLSGICNFPGRKSELLKQEICVCASGLNLRATRPDTLKLRIFEVENVVWMSSNDFLDSFLK